MDKELISQVVDEIERRKHISRLRDSLSWAVANIANNAKEKRVVQSKLDDLNKSLSWWNKWFLQGRIKHYEQELEIINNNIAMSEKAAKIFLKDLEFLKNER